MEVIIAVDMVTMATIHMVMDIAHNQHRVSLILCLCLKSFSGSLVGRLVFMPIFKDPVTQFFHGFIS
jgi:hypothetical protein